MPLNIGDIYKITANQVYGGQLMQNVFMYEYLNPAEGVGVPAQIQTILNAFKTEVGDVMRTVQVGAVNHTSYRFDNLTDGVTFGELLVNLAGFKENVPSPSFLAVNVKLVRLTGITRNGSKRIGGISEDATSGNTLLWSGPEVAAIQNAFGSAIHNPVGAENIGAPVIVGRTEELNEDGDLVYVLDLTKVNPIVSAQVTALTTQRSRKVGHGV